MKDLVYPAILYKDDEKGTNTGEFTISVPDLGIVTEGANPTAAYLNAKAMLCTLVDCAIKFDCEIESPSDFMGLYGKETKKGNIVILIDALA